MHIITVHGWAFCPSVFKNLPFEVDHFVIDYSKGLRENANLLRERLTKDTVLVGWSLGATLSVLASYKKPIKGLVLIGATPYFGRAWKEVFIERFFKELDEDYEGKLLEFRKTAYGEVDCPTPPKKGAIKLLKEFVNSDISNLLKELSLKTVLLHGKKDPITPFREFKKLLKLNPRFEGIPYDGGHFPIHFFHRDWQKVFESFQKLP